MSGAAFGLLTVVAICVAVAGITVSTVALRRARSAVNNNSSTGATGVGGATGAAGLVGATGVAGGSSFNVQALRATSNGSQIIIGGATGAVQFQNGMELSNGWTIGASNTLFTVPASGIYFVSYMVPASAVFSDAVLDFRCWLRRNGAVHDTAFTTVLTLSPDTSGGLGIKIGGTLSAGANVSLTAGDTIEVLASAQTSVTDVQLTSGFPGLSRGPSLSAFRIA